jgi:hypothetical protein
MGSSMAPSGDGCNDKCPSNSATSPTRKRRGLPSTPRRHLLRGSRMGGIGWKPKTRGIRSESGLRGTRRRDPFFRGAGEDGSISSNLTFVGPADPRRGRRARDETAGFRANGPGLPVRGGSRYDEREARRANPPHRLAPGTPPPDPSPRVRSCQKKSPMGQVLTRGVRSSNAGLRSTSVADQRRVVNVAAVRLGLFCTSKRALCVLTLGGSSGIQRGEKTRRVSASDRETSERHAGSVGAVSTRTGGGAGGGWVERFPSDEVNGEDGRDSSDTPPAGGAPAPRM